MKINHGAIETQSLQEKLIEMYRNNKTKVEVHLQRGIRLCGEIAEYDSNIITLKDNEKTQIVYKHAISTIVPGISDESV